MAGGKKEHVDKVRESKFNRQRCETTELRSNNGKDGYVFKNTVASGASAGTVNAAGQCEFHHVLPITSLQDAKILEDKTSKAQKDFLHKCMATTNWNINKQPNLIGLPTKRPFEQADRRVAHKKKDRRLSITQILALRASSGEFGALPNLPCHLNDHPDYTDEVIKDLDKNLWPDLLEEAAECEDKGKNIRSLLQGFSRDWKSWLKTRGSDHGGAADCWLNREQNRNGVVHTALDGEGAAKDGSTSEYL